MRKRGYFSEKYTPAQSAGAQPLHVVVLARGASEGCGGAQELSRVMASGAAARVIAARPSRDNACVHRPPARRAQSRAASGGVRLSRRHAWRAGGARAE
jgi:hypothetical protein